MTVERRPSRSWIENLVAGAALLAGIVAVSVPSTSGAFVAEVKHPVNNTGVAERISCLRTFLSPANRQNAYLQYRLVGSASTEPDSSTAGNPGSFQAGGDHPSAPVTPTVACPLDSGSYYQPNGTTNWIQTTTSLTSPATATLTIWFSTTSPGYLLGFNSSQTQTTPPANYDRHLYVDVNGKVQFGTFSSSGGYSRVSSGASVMDGKWHQAVATISSGKNMALWIDGVKVSQVTSPVAADTYTGYWRVAFGSLDGWADAPSSAYFKGGLRFAAVYSTVLSDREIALEYGNGKPTS